MSPQGFQAYASLWLLCSAVLLTFAIRIAAAPWLPTGEPPEYALWLLRATEAKPPPACRISVRDLSGREVVVTTADSCEGAAPAAQPAAGATRQTPGDARRAALLRILASGLHSALSLLVAGLASWGLRKALRRTFRRPAGFAWVSQRRA
jgi:hypothetical protein